MDIGLGHLSKPCACGKEHRIDVEEVSIEPGAATKLMDILENYQNPVFICDSNTRAAAEPYLEEEFKDYPVIELNPEGLRADDRKIHKVMKQLDYCDRGLCSVSVDILVAIGSGTIHDLTRYAAAEYEIPFVSVPTAASNDGYASNVISVTWEGIKKTLPGVSPRWILADTNILTKAPKRLTAAGVGDLLAKHIALFDWKISHMVTGEYVCSEVCELEERAMREVEKDADEIFDRDPEAVEKLMYGLILSGLCMQMVETPRPASGAEHMMAHVWDMEVLHPSYHMLHGESVGVASLYVLEVYKKLGRAIRHGNVEVKDELARSLEYGLLEQYFGDKTDEILAVNEPNPLEDVDLERLQELLPDIEDEIRDLPDRDQLMRWLSEAGCVTDMEGLGLSVDLIPATLAISPYVRNRMTLLRVMKLLKVSE